MYRSYSGRNDQGEVTKEERWFISDEGDVVKVKGLLVRLFVSYEWDGDDSRTDEVRIEGVTQSLAVMPDAFYRSKEEAEAALVIVKQDTEEAEKARALWQEKDRSAARRRSNLKI